MADANYSNDIIKEYLYNYLGKPTWVWPIKCNKENVKRNGC